jgi:hypothetical protein
MNERINLAQAERLLSNYSVTIPPSHARAKKYLIASRLIAAERGSENDARMPYGRASCRSVGTTIGSDDLRERRLLDHLVRAHQQAGGKRQPQPRCRPLIDDDLECRRLLNREIAGSLALQDSIDYSAARANRMDILAP